MGRILLLVGVFLMTLSTTQITAGAVRERLLLDFGWRFHLGDAAEPAKDFGYGTGEPWAKAGQAVGPGRPDFGDGDWRIIDLPHDWAVELPFDRASDMAHGFKPIGRARPAGTIGWYRRSFHIPKSDLGRRLSIEFDGVFRNCIIWLNGHFVGRHLSGYTSFQYDVTDCVNYGGTNVLAVRVDAGEFEGWFYEGAGIYRHVWLVKTAPVHVAHWGTFVTSEVKAGPAEVTARARIVNETDENAAVSVAWTVFDPDGRAVTRAESQPLTIVARGEIEPIARMPVAGPRLWSIQSPNLYRLATVVRKGAETVDSVETPFGIRTIRFDPERGFFLNGKEVKIKGVCCHQDHAGVGSALPDRVQYYRIERLKEMGCNAYRTSHNPPTPELLDACDQLGMLVMDEHRMMGSSPEIIGQLEGLVLRDRNHPCVILWSIGNEEGFQGTETSVRVAQSMIRTVRRLDPTRPITYAANNGNQYEGINSVVDVRGVNYVRIANWDVDAYHQAHPTQPVFGSEEASTLCTRGIYANDPARGYVCAYDVNAPDWGSTAEKWWKYVMERPWYAGAFVWTGFDYRGEPTPYQWPCISSHFGIMDTCGFPKDNFYYYQAWWSDRTVLHLLPHWNWPGKEGQEIAVWCHSNCEKVELFLNGKSLGARRMTPNSHLEWKVPYTPGRLEARGYKGAQLVATRRVDTTGPAFKLLLVPDRSKIAADGEDVAMVAVSVFDARGRAVPVADNEVGFEVQGDARIIGVGSGDPSSHEPDRCFAAPMGRPIIGWRMKPVDGVENRPEVAADHNDADWQQVAVDAAEATSIQAQNSCAVFRATAEVSEEEIRRGMTRLCFGMIDDLGWVYVNGKLIGQTGDWSRSHTLDAKEALRPGKNAIAVVVKNVGGQGGLAKGVLLAEAQGPPRYKRKLFNGLCQVIVQAGKTAGQVQLIAESPGLEPARLTIQIEAAAPRPSVP